MTTLLLILLVCGGLLAALLYSGKVSQPAWADGGVEATVRDLRQGLKVERQRVTRGYEVRCRPAPRYYKRPEELGRARLEQGIRSRLRALREVRERRSICDREGRVVELVFRGRAQVALAIGRCESHLYRYAVGAAGERGIFQIHPVHASWLGALWARLFNPLVNAQVAWRMSRQGTSWGAWTCARMLGIP